MKFQNYKINEIYYLNNYMIFFSKFLINEILYLPFL